MTRPFVHAACLVALALATFALRAQDAPATDPWEPEIAAFEARDRADPPTAGDIVFVGSSSIRMWSTLAEDFPGLPVVNRGFGGSRIADSTRFAERILLPHHPRLVVLYAGDNDVADGASAERVLADVEAFVARVHALLPKTRIAFISIKPSPSRAALLPTMQAANARVRDYAGKTAGVDFVDVASGMLDANGRPRADLFGPDRLHMNAAGYALWTRTIAPELTR